MIFDPHSGTGSSLVATSTNDFTAIHEAYAADQQEREDAIRLRSMRDLGFGQRSSVCG